MNRLSVIIPYHSTPAELESSLLSLLENRPEDCEIRVVLNQSYENIYELGEEEVHFLDVEKQIIAENRLVSDCMRLGLAACDSTYVYMMPAGVQFHSEWLEALEIMDQSEDLGAFFLDANLTLGGFFRKPLLDSFLQNSEEAGFSAESDAECLMNLVSLMQEANLPCGLAEFESTEEETEVDSSHDLAIDSQSEIRMNFEIKPGIETEPGREAKVKTEFKQEIKVGTETEPTSKPFPSKDSPETTGLLARFCARFRGFFK